MTVTAVVKSLQAEFGDGRGDGIGLLSVRGPAQPAIVGTPNPITKKEEAQKSDKVLTVN